MVRMIQNGTETQNRIWNAVCSQSCPYTASAAPITVITTAMSAVFQPKMPLRPSLMMMVSTTLNARNVKPVAISGKITPWYPNWARDWIICGRPSLGPCDACAAMKSVPNRMPAIEATQVHHRLRPNTGPRNPMLTVKGWKLPRNQNGPCMRTLPCRSSSGT